MSNKLRYPGPDELQHRVDGHLAHPLPPTGVVTRFDGFVPDASDRPSDEIVAAISTGAKTCSIEIMQVRHRMLTRMLAARIISLSEVDDVLAGAISVSVEDEK